MSGRNGALSRDMCPRRIFEEGVAAGAVELQGAAPLTSFADGARLEVCCLCMGPNEAQRMRDLGLREGASCVVVLNNGKVIVSVDSSRIALRRELAMQVFGRPADER